METLNSHSSIHWPVQFCNQLNQISREGKCRSGRHLQDLSSDPYSWKRSTSTPLFWRKIGNTQRTWHSCQNSPDICGQTCTHHDAIFPKKNSPTCTPLFWRNMETHREPDIHVKTVLIFVAKPAPTMMQFSLRKTAQESKAGHPEVAKVLTSNTYQMRSGNLQIQKRKLGN